jgi:hypothetical protein
MTKTIRRRYRLAIFVTTNTARAPSRDVCSASQSSIALWTVFGTLKLDQFFQSYVLEEDVVEETKATFEKNKTSGSLTISCIDFTEQGLSVSILTFPPGCICPKSIGSFYVEDS